MLSDHHGFSTTTSVDHRPWLWTVGLLSLIYSALALGARVMSKWGLLWFDDAILTAAYVSCFREYMVGGPLADDSARPSRGLTTAYSTNQSPKAWERQRFTSRANMQTVQRRYDKSMDAFILTE